MVCWWIISKKKAWFVAFADFCDSHHSLFQATNNVTTSLHNSCLFDYKFSYIQFWVQACAKPSWFWAWYWVLISKKTASNEPTSCCTEFLQQLLLAWVPELGLGARMRISLICVTACWALLSHICKNPPLNGPQSSSLRVSNRIAGPAF